MAVWAFDFLGAIFWPNNLLTKFCRSKKASFNIGFLQKIASLLASNKSNGFNFRYLVKSRCMKKDVGIAFQKFFQPIIVAYLHHHGLFGCHDCQQIPLHAVHQRDPKQGKIKRSVVYRRPKYSAEAKGFHYLAFCFGRWNFIPNIRPSVFS